MNKAILAFFTAFLSLSLVSDTITPKAHRTIKGNETVYTSEQVDKLLLQAGKVKHIAMFIIPMNSTSSTTPTSSFKHFELKASTNNFDSTKSDVDKMCYYTHSGHADEFNILENDKARIFVNHGGTDDRSYVNVPNTIEYLLSYAPESYIVLVDATQCWPSRSDGSWLNSESDNLMWTYVKTMNGSREVDAGTDHGLWRPIQPVKWFSELPNWAK